MASYKDNINRIEIIAEGLQELVTEAVFTGGACIQFYVSNPKLRDYRPTKDIDCIVKIYSYSEFAKLSDRLRHLGFKNDTSENAPIVRWIYKGVYVDTIPEESSVVGYRDIKWFKEGKIYTIEKELPSGKRIKILSLSYFLATKLEAWQDRGGGDFLADPDIEDIISILDGTDDLNEILTSPVSVRNYLIQSFDEFLKNDNFKRSIAGHIGFETSASERAGEVINKIEKIVEGRDKNNNGIFA